MSKRTPGHALWAANDAISRYTDGTWADANRSLWEELAQVAIDQYEANKASAPDESSTRLANGTGTFGDALVAMHAGRTVTRAGFFDQLEAWVMRETKWKGAVRPRIHRREGAMVHEWLDHEDVLASDWSVLP